MQKNKHSSQRNLPSAVGRPDTEERAGCGDAEQSDRRLLLRGAALKVLDSERTGLPQAQEGTGVPWGHAASQSKG